MVTDVQSKSYASTASNTSHSVTLDTAPTPGNYVFLFANSDEFIDTATVTGYTRYVFSQDFCNVACYYRKIQSGDSATITITIAASNSMALFAWELSGLEPVAANLVDKTATAINQGGAGSISSGTTAVTSQANEFTIAALGQSGITHAFNTYTNSFTEKAEIFTSGSAVNVRLAIAYKDLSSTGPQSTLCTMSGNTGGNDVGAIGTFRKAAEAVLIPFVLLAKLDL